MKKKKAEHISHGLYSRHFIHEKPVVLKNCIRLDQTSKRQVNSWLSSLQLYNYDTIALNKGYEIVNL